MNKRKGGVPSCVGVLAEDITDCDVVVALIRVIHKDKKVGVKRYGANGAPALRKKLRSQIKRMLKQGCSAFIIMHDLDRGSTTKKLNDKALLMRELEQIVDSTGVDLRFICIPVEELEAWFWSDQAVLDKVAGDNTAKAHHHPHMIDDPKSKLERLSYKNGKAQHSSNQNKELVGILDINVCAQRCLEFAALRDFIATL